MQKYEPQNKEINVNVQQLTPTRLRRQILYDKKKNCGKVFVGIDNCVDAAIQGVEVYINKNKEKLIAARTTEKLQS